MFRYNIALDNILVSRNQFISHRCCVLLKFWVRKGQVTFKSVPTDDRQPNAPRRDWLRFVAALAFIALLVGAGWFGLTSYLNTSNPVLVVEGNSMFPTLKDGDLVLLKGVSSTEIAEDFQDGQQDIIVFFSDIYKRYVVHRVHNIATDESGAFLGFVTKGDNNNVVDPGVVTESEVLGKVINHIPFLGSFVKFFRSPPGAVLLAIVIIVLIVWSVVDEIGKAKTRPAKKTEQRPLTSGRTVSQHYGVPDRIQKKS